MATKRTHRCCLWEAWPTSLCCASASVRLVLLPSMMLWRSGPVQLLVTAAKMKLPNKYLALCTGGSAAFHETVRKLQKDVTNFTFVLQNPAETKDRPLFMHDFGHLINLEAIIITSTLQGPFKYSRYRLHWKEKDLFNSVNLTTLQINIFILKLSPQLNNSLAMLEELDLSNTRMQFFSPSTIYNLVQSTSPSRLRALNFHFSTAATYPFQRLDFYKMLESSTQWEHLEKFDFSQNGVSSLSPGVYHRLPKLKYINLSNNIIGTYRNDTEGTLLELLMHPVLEVINLSNQKGADVPQLRAKRYIRTLEE